MTLPRVRLFLATALLAGCAFFNVSAFAADVITTTPLETGSVGQFTSQAIVTGNPAISYYDVANHHLVYVRATNAARTAWGTPVTVASTGDVGKYTSLVIVNGNPAISYYDTTTGSLNYVRATDVSGAGWGTPVALVVVGAGGGANSMAVVNGNPAICYYDGLSQSLKYVRATTADGTLLSDWGTPVLVEATGDVGDHCSMAMVGGQPAISYYDGDISTGGLRFIRAANADGSSWSTSVLVQGIVNVGFYTSLAIVNGNPAISYFDVDNLDLKYVRATNAGGTAWGAPITLDSVGSVGWYSSLSIINGYPAIGYWDATNHDLKYVRALTADGTLLSDWRAPVAVDHTTDNVGEYASLISLDGGAAISYYDATNGALKWATITGITSGLTASGTYNSAITTYSITASGSPTSYSATGLPPGLSVNTATGDITGTPTDASASPYFVTIGATNSNGTGTAILLFTINKASQATLSVSSSASGTFGSAYAATSSGGSGAGAVTWSLGSGSTAASAAVSSGGAVTSSGAGTVVIKATKAQDANYLPATSSDFTITLAKATQATLNVTSAATGTFGSSYTATATGGSGAGAVTWSLGSGSTAAGAAVSSGGAVTSSGAGTVVIKATKATDTDYLSATSADFTVTLAKATQATLSVSSSASGTFNTAYTAASSGGSGAGAVTWSLGSGSTAAGAAISSGGAVTSSGAGTVVIKATKATDTDYLFATSADFTVTLAKATQATLSVSSSATGTFNTAYAATSSGGSGAGTVTWSLGSGSTAAGAAISSGGAVTSSGAGTVVIKATKATDTNYLVASSADFTVTLSAASATVTLSSLAVTYDGSTHAASATTTPASLTVNFTYNGSATAPTNAGTYAVVGTISDSNYSGSASGSLVIAQATPVITWAAPAPVNPGTALSSAQLNATSGVAGSFTYSPVSGTVLTGGFQTLTASFTPTDTVNYTSTSAQQTLAVITAPVVTTQPLSRPVFVGSSTTFVAVVSGAPTPAFQWQKNGIDIPGATSSSLTLNNVQLTDAGSYALIATSVGGTVTSRFARLVVLVSQQNAITYATTVSSTGVTAGGVVNFDYFVTNVGTKAWGATHYLSIRDINNTFVAFSKLIGVLPGENTTANLSFPAPTTPGTYTYYVQALEDGVEFFSTQTTVTLTVLAPLPNSITYNTTTFPVSAAPGSNVIFTYNVTNTGTATWGANHYLSLKNGSGTTLSTTPLTVLVPGASKTVNLSLTAPTTPGSYNYTVQASETGVGNFNTTANLTLVVLAPQPNAIVYNRVRYPDDVVPGATLNLKYTLSNAGTQSWGAGHYVSLRDSNAAYLSFIPLSGTAPSATKTIEFTITAPTTPGTYTYFVQALEDGIEFFSTQDVVIVNVIALPRGNAVSYNTNTFPITAARGATINFTANVTNHGTRAWGATHYLSFRDVDNTFLAFPSLSGVAPGASRTSNLSIVAPATPGIYTYTLEAFEDGVSFFEMSDTVVLVVP